jgi:serine protease Do
MENEKDQNLNKLDEEDDDFFSCEESQFYEESEPWEKRPGKSILFRFLAAFTFLAFLVFVFITTWPGLTLPSLDFLKQSEKLSQNEAVNKLKQYVVRIDTISFTTGRTAEQKSGTGFNISPQGVIITNRHVLSGALKATVTFADGKIFTAKSFRSSSDSDLAVIYLGASNLPYTTINAARSVREGEKVLIIGNPLGIGNVAVEGTVASYVRVAGFSGPVLVINASIYPGSSGSPVFDQNHQVVGIIFGVITPEKESEPQGAALPVKDVAGFIRMAMEEDEGRSSSPGS